MFICKFFLVKLQRKAESLPETVTFTFMLYYQF